MGLDGAESPPSEEGGYKARLPRVDTIHLTGEAYLLDFLGNLQRTHYCGALRASDEGRDAIVMGWVSGRRDLGNLLFLDIRDRTGIVQVVFNKESQPVAHAKAEQARSEFVVAVEGKVIKRQSRYGGI